MGAHTVCGTQDGGATRQTSPGTTTADAVCAACAGGTWAAADTGNCAAHTVCGDQEDGSTRQTSAGTTTADAVCAACDAGTSASADTDDCVEAATTTAAPAAPDATTAAPLADTGSQIVINVFALTLAVVAGSLLIKLAFAGPPKYP